MVWEAELQCNRLAREASGWGRCSGVRKSSQLTVAQLVAASDPHHQLLGSENDLERSSLSGARRLKAPALKHD